MKLFSEDLTAQYRIIHFFRAGPVADRYGAPWLYPVLCCSNDGVNCLLLGYAAQDAPAGVVWRIARLAVAEARRLGFTGKVEWERRESDDEMRRFEVPKAA